MKVSAFAQRSKTSVLPQLLEYPRKTPPGWLPRVFLAQPPNLAYTILQMYALVLMDFYSVQSCASPKPSLSSVEPCGQLWRHSGRTNGYVRIYFGQRIMDLTWIM